MTSTPVSLGRLLGNALELDSFIENCRGEGYRLTLNADYVLTAEPARSRSTLTSSSGAPAITLQRLSGLTAYRDPTAGRLCIAGSMRLFNAPPSDSASRTLFTGLAR